MKPIVYIKGSELTDVRLNKFIHFFMQTKQKIEFWGWSRNGDRTQIKGVAAQYLLSGGGYGKKHKLFFYYFVWCCVVFFKCLRSNLKDKIVIAIDFDCALPVYLASKFKRFNYVYEIYDDFSLRYNFPTSIRDLVHNIDKKIMNKSQCVIHVDSNRVIYKDCKWIVIENTPVDIFEEKSRNYASINHQFAVIGHFSRQRGMNSILQFAKDNPSCQFLVVGRFIEETDKEAFIALPNVVYNDPIPQAVLYEKMKHCCAIFSLYDPKVEINRLAASNKVYDAMMFGIPVITNHEVINSSFIKENNIGFVVDYDYNDSWSCLTSEEFMEQVKVKGKNGRRIYLEKYQFSILVRERLVPILNEL